MPELAVHLAGSSVWVRVGTFTVKSYIPGPILGLSGIKWQTLILTGEEGPKLILKCDLRESIGF